MTKSLPRWVLGAIAAFVWAVPALAVGAGSGALVGVSWLAERLGRDDLMVLDASPSPMHAAGHIPGAIGVDWFSFGLSPGEASEVERRFRSWGVRPGRKIVIYDRGGDMMATRLFFDLYFHGVPAEDLAILDGGLAKWRELGHPVTQDATPPPEPGTFRYRAAREEARVRLPEFLNASGDPARNALVDALSPAYHFGEAKFFDRAGHVPHAVMLPMAEFYNPDKTFKSADEIARMLRHLGIRPEQTIHAYCGGGIAASVPFFAIRFLAGYPSVKLYVESQLEWLRDDRGLPLWTWDAPHLVRDRGWLNGWGSRIVRSYGVSRVSVVDVRSADAYAGGHVPFALNLPASSLRTHLAKPEGLAGVLGPAGVDADYEAVVVSDGGLTPGAALAFVLLQKAGQKRVSILLDTMDDWGLGGLPLTKDATIVGSPRTPQDHAVPAAVYPARIQPDVLVGNAAQSTGLYPKLFVASGATVPDRALPGKVVHVPYTELLKADGTPKPANEVWKALEKAGVTRYAEILCIAEDPAEAAVNYVVLKMMGFPDVKVLRL